jgi:hypothetical protein
MADKKEYRIFQNEGKITWTVEELWDGGVTRGPYGSRDAAIGAEKRIAEANGFAGDLVIHELGEQKTLPTESFEKDENGNYRCLKGCSIEIDKKEIVFAEGMEFTKGHQFMGVDVVKWLDENLQK